jgi:hypothetical protein
VTQVSKARPGPRVREPAVKATEADAKMAEEEWERVTHEPGSPQFSASGRYAADVGTWPIGVGYVNRVGLGWKRVTAV